MPTIYKRLHPDQNLNRKVSVKCKDGMKRKRLMGWTYQAIGDHYGLSYNTVWVTLNGRKRKYVKDPKNGERVARLRARKKLLGKAKFIPIKDLRAAEKIGLNVNDIWEDYGPEKEEKKEE